MAILAKDQEWEQVFDVVARTVDGMGKRIDTGIMGVVLGLNAHGIRTTMSCEGHLDHGNPYPWVWVPTEDQGKLVEVLNAFNHANEEEGQRAMDRMPVIVCGFVEGECVLQSFGAACQNERDPKLKTERLAEYQREMQCFAVFLRDKFFEGGNNHG